MKEIQIQTNGRADGKEIKKSHIAHFYLTLRFNNFGWYCPNQ
jgi:hypothetical protein